MYSIINNIFYNTKNYNKYVFYNTKKYSRHTPSVQKNKSF